MSKYAAGGYVKNGAEPMLWGDYVIPRGAYNDLVIALNHDGIFDEVIKNFNALSASEIEERVARIIKDRG